MGVDPRFLANLRALFTTVAVVTARPGVQRLVAKFDRSRHLSALQSTVDGQRRSAINLRCFIGRACSCQGTKVPRLARSYGVRMCQSGPLELLDYLYTHNVKQHSAQGQGDGVKMSGILGNVTDHLAHHHGAVRMGGLRPTCRSRLRNTYSCKSKGQLQHIAPVPI
ncbi:hypothetical protein EV356DRAFT_22900 [Viridothelium virens]|uniref:Uncharacterized protein n=1 Tax=Viridothelium virens TaxID=1048519 RepID=A0A6A6GTY3_VIRVR|nr:hypothetical protein EV356DRAFT_22900 [Viridothelium virens]